VSVSDSDDVDNWTRQQIGPVLLPANRQHAGRIFVAKPAADIIDID
jgi:hypothetical protein